MSGIFKHFGLAYGHLWTSQLRTQQVTEDMLSAWGVGLRDVRADQIGLALKNLPAKPPSLPAFRDLCLHGKESMAAHKRFPPALPKPKAKQRVVQAEIAKMREILGRRSR